LEKRKKEELSERIHTSTKSAKRYPSFLEKALFKKRASKIRKGKSSKN